MLTSRPTSNAGNSTTSTITRMSSSACCVMSKIESGVMHAASGMETRRQSADDQRPAIDENEQHQLERQRNDHRRQHHHAHGHQHARDHEVDDQKRDEQQKTDLESSFEFACN